MSGSIIVNATEATPGGWEEVIPGETTYLYSLADFYNATSGTTVKSLYIYGRKI